VEKSTPHPITLTRGGGFGAPIDATTAVGRCGASGSTVMGMGKMTNHAFYDSILKENRIPLEMVRALLTKQKLSRDYASNRKFYGPIQAGN
jgi:hypothetical protein